MAHRLRSFLLIAGILYAGSGAQGFVLQIEMANRTGGSAAIFYDIGQWYNERDCSRVSITPGDQLHPYRFHLPAQPIHRLRFDLTDHPGPVQVGRIELLSDDGKVLDRFGPAALRPMNHIESIAARPDGTIVAEAGPDNPMLLIDRELQAETERALGRHFVGAATLLILSLVVLAGVMLCTARAIPPARWVFWGAFLFIAGVRLYWLKLYSRPMPFWDEWEMEGRDLLMPLRGHFLDWQALVLPQSEHRSLISRLIALCTSILNGEWDPRLGMVAGVLFYAASIALPVAAVVATRIRMAWLAAAAFIVVAVFPFDAHNLLCGDQCQMYALNLLSMVVLMLATIAEPTAMIISALLIASCLCLFTMASGCVAPLLAGAVALLPRAGVPWRRRAPIAVIGFGAFVVGLLLYQPAPFQAPTYAHTAAEFFTALTGRLAWPLHPTVLGAMIVWLPVVLFTAFQLGRHAEPIDRLILVLALWVLADAVGLAHGRPQDGWPFNNKYYTASFLILPLSVLAVVRLPWSRLGLAAVTVSNVALVPALLATWSILRDSLPVTIMYWRQQASYDALVRPFLRTGNAAPLVHATSEQLPYWNGAELAAQLASPLMRPWLPAVLRAAHPGPLTIAARELMKSGPYLAAAGAAILVFAVVRAPRTPRSTTPRPGS